MFILPELVAPLVCIIPPFLLTDEDNTQPYDAGSDGGDEEEPLKD